jgi:hypothetical protein
MLPSCRVWGSTARPLFVSPWDLSVVVAWFSLPLQVRVVVLRARLGAPNLGIVAVRSMPNCLLSLELGKG